jgi:hypothetical protein
MLATVQPAISRTSSSRQIESETCLSPKLIDLLRSLFAAIEIISSSMLAVTGVSWLANPHLSITRCL